MTGCLILSVLVQVFFPQLPPNWKTSIVKYAIPSANARAPESALGQHYVKTPIATGRINSSSDISCFPKHFLTECPLLTPGFIYIWFGTKDNPFYSSHCHFVYPSRLFMATCFLRPVSLLTGLCCLLLTLVVDAQYTSSLPEPIPLIHKSPYFNAWIRADANLSTPEDRWPIFFNGHVRFP